MAILNKEREKKIIFQTPWLSVRKRTIPTAAAGEVNADFCG
jgi:hypothetical protein